MSRYSKNKHKFYLAEISVICPYRIFWSGRQNNRSLGRSPVQEEMRYALNIAWIISEYIFTHDISILVPMICAFTYMIRLSMASFNSFTLNAALSICAFIFVNNSCIAEVFVVHYRFNYLLRLNEFACWNTVRTVLSCLCYRNNTFELGI